MGSEVAPHNHQGLLPEAVPRRGWAAGHHTGRYSEAAGRRTLLRAAVAGMAVGPGCRWGRRRGWHRLVGVPAGLGRAGLAGVGRRRVER